MTPFDFLNDINYGKKNLMMPAHRYGAFDPGQHGPTNTSIHKI